MNPYEFIVHGNNLGVLCVLAVLEQIRSAGRGTELFFEPRRREERKGFFMVYRQLRLVGYIRKILAIH